MQRRLHIIALATLIFSPALAWGLSVTGASGVSGLTLTGTVTVYGGMGGAACTGNNVSTCNNCNTAAYTADSCTTAPLCVCNTTRIYDGLAATITLRKNTNNANRAIVVKGTDASATVVTINNPTNDGTSVSIPWTNICQQLTTPSTCEAAADASTVTLKIFIDNDNSGTFTSGDEGTDVIFRIVKPSTANYSVYGAPTTEGIGAFSPYPGDEKVYIEGIESTTGFPTTGYGGGIKIRAVRVFVSDGNMTTAHAEGPLEPEDLPVITGGNEVDNAIVDGLENGVLYTFRLALVDEAGNLVQYFPDGNPGGDCNTTPTLGGCNYATQPDQVLGLLTEDINCFIATAAYGTQLEPKLAVLRRFRNHILIQNHVGRAVIDSYYKYGPMAARFIHDKPMLRAAARAAIWPAYGFSWLALELGFWFATAITCFVAASLLALPWYGVRRYMTRA